MVIRCLSFCDAHCYCYYHYLVQKRTDVDKDCFLILNTMTSYQDKQVGLLVSRWRHRELLKGYHKSESGVKCSVCSDQQTTSDVATPRLVTSGCMT